MIKVTALKKVTYLSRRSTHSCLLPISSFLLPICSFLLLLLLLLLEGLARRTDKARQLEPQCPWRPQKNGQRTSKNQRISDSPQVASGSPWKLISKNCLLQKPGVYAVAHSCLVSLFYITEFVFLKHGSRQGSFDSFHKRFLLKVNMFERIFVHSNMLQNSV